MPWGVTLPQQEARLLLHLIAALLNGGSGFLLLLQQYDTQSVNCLPWGVTLPQRIWISLEPLLK